MQLSLNLNGSDIRPVSIDNARKHWITSYDARSSFLLSAAHRLWKFGGRPIKRNQQQKCRNKAIGSAIVYFKTQILRLQKSVQLQFEDARFEI